MDAWLGSTCSIALLRVLLRAALNHVLPKCRKKSTDELRSFGRLHPLPGVLLFLGDVAVHGGIDHHGGRHDLRHDSGLNSLRPEH